jgi:glutamine synthetase
VPVDQQERERLAARARQVRSEVAEQGVVALATTWVDNSGITRVKAVPIRRLEYAAAWGIGASTVFDAFLPDDSIVAGRHAGGPVGDLRLHPDLGRVTVLAEQPGWAWAPAVRYRQDGAVHPQDQRSIAGAAVAALADAGFTARMAFEIEWTLSATEPDFTPAASGPAYGYTRLVERSDYLRDLLIALDRQHVTVDQIHPEYGSAQYEISVANEDPVGAADTFVLVRETIRALSMRYGLRASFSPKVLADGVGNGGHVHVSVWRDDVNLFSARPSRYGMRKLGARSARYGMRKEAEAFTAGVLAHLPALLAIGAPSPASYLRLIPSHWAGPFQVWGLENREAALRLITGSPGNPAAANLEVKAFDQSANPYLVVAGLLHAGMAGISAAAELPDPVNVDPATLPAESQAGFRLPTTLRAAIDAFEGDEVLTTALGETLAATIVDLRRAEVARFADATPEDIVAAARWRY